jgi:hypothetical protein
MPESIKCNWCNNYGASAWTKTIDKKKFTSKQKFCSLKCKSEFEDRRNIEWKEETNYLWVIIAIIIVLSILSKG